MKDLNSITGPCTLDNGMSIIGVQCGGDWEYPVYFIIYWDGKSLRGYIPTDGNPWNTDDKIAYGNNAESDAKNVEKRFGIKDQDPLYACSKGIDKDKVVAEMERQTDFAARAQAMSFGVREALGDETSGV